VGRVETLDQDDVESGAPDLVAARLAFYYSQRQGLYDYARVTRS
jgi:hypothetical protein